VPVAAWRWGTVLRGLSRPAPLKRLMLTHLAAICINNVTPASRLAGEACRVVALVRGRIAATSTAVISIMYDRLSEVPAVVVLGIVGLAALGRRVVPAIALSTVAVAVLATCVAGFAAAWAWPRVKRQVASLHAVTLAPRVLGLAAVVSGGLWMLDVMRLRAAAAAVGAPVTLMQSALLSAITIVAGLVPSVGGLGVIEGGLVGGLVAFGVRPTDAAAITAIERGISYGLGTIAGAGALSALGGRALWDAVRARVVAAS
ncbi:MAG TPA: lysylphosphatidylglycerol synthase transmembrane domain-containing protein, partial [Rhodanobacteraceae bacterium]